MLHPIGTIDALNRGNLTPVRQIESAISSILASRPPLDHIARHDQTDPTLAQIAAQFTQHSVEKSGGAYLILDRPTANAIARLRPIPGTDRFELFYWSNLKGRWTTFGNLGRMRLMLETAHEIVEKNPIFHISHAR